MAEVKPLSARRSFHWLLERPRRPGMFYFFASAGGLQSLVAIIARAAKLIAAQKSLTPIYLVRSTFRVEDFVILRPLLCLRCSFIIELKIAVCRPSGSCNRKSPLGRFHTLPKRPAVSLDCLAHRVTSLSHIPRGRTCPNHSQIVVAV